MKRVLAVLLCLLCAMLLLVACGDNNTDTDNQGSNNTDNQGHVHTYKTNEEWTKDAQGHWYDATCDCEDVQITKLNHTDANNDGACDVCAFTNHEHEYTEDWTADCTNHWNAADCGHTVAGINVGAHVDEDADGRCDVCNYIIEDLHEHFYSSEWSNDGEYHWHAALCEHKVEVADKAAHIINNAGMCTECDAKIKNIDKTDILAILKAALANNNKVISGTVYAKEFAYEGTKAEAGKTEEVYFVLGDGASYVKWGSYNMNNVFIGVDQYWFELLEDESIFGVQMPYYNPSSGGRNNNLELFPVSGETEKLSGYTYLPGASLAAYDDTTTLAQTLYNYYDILVLGVNVSDVVTSYDEKTGKYTFSYNYFTVNTTEGNTEQDGSGDAIVSYYVEYYQVDVLFTVNSDFVVNFAEFSIESYRGLEGVDEDLTYDPQTNTVTLTANADPTTYEYSVSQTSGKRVYTSIYSKAALLPIDFDLSLVTKTDFSATGSTIIASEEPIVDIDGDGIVDLVVDKEKFVRLHLGNILPKSANASFMDTGDFMATYVNIEGNGSPWGSPEFYQAPYFDSYMNCIAFRTQNSGKYLVTIKFGQVEKQISLTVLGEAEIIAPDDTDDTKYVIVTETNSWVDEYTFTAKESGKYTFTLPVGLGFVFEGADLPVYDPFDPNGFDENTHTVEFDLAKGKSVTFFVGAMEKGLYEIAVAFVAGEVEGDDGQGGDEPPAEDINIIGTYTNSKLTLVIDETTATFTLGQNTTSVTYEIIDGQVVLYNADGNAWSTSVLAINLTNGNVTSAVYSGTKYNLTAFEEDDGEESTGTGVEEDPFVITVGDYVADYKGNSLIYYTFTAEKDGFITVTGKFDGQIWLVLGNLTNEGEGDSLATYVPAGGKIKIAVGDWNDQPNNVPFTVSFEEKTTEDFSALCGTWYGKSEDIWTILYTLTINTNGSGKFSFDMGFGATEYNLTYVFKDGETVLLGYAQGTLVCTFDGTTFACSKGIMQDAFVFQTTPIEDGEDDDNEDEPIEGTDSVKELLVGSHTVGEYTVLIYNSLTDGYIAEVFGGDVDLYFTFDVTDNGDNTYTLALTYFENPDYETGIEKLEEILALDMVITPNAGDEEGGESTDSLKEAVFGEYTLGDYQAYVYSNEGYYVYVSTSDWSVELYFTYEVIDNEDGTYKIVLTHDEREYDVGADKVEEILALDFTVTLEGEADKTPLEAFTGSCVENAIDGCYAEFTYDTDSSNYYLNVYGGADNLYYICDVTENEDGSITLVLDFDEEHWSYFGDAKNDVYELDGKTIVVTKDGNTWVLEIQADMGETEFPEDDEAL